MVIHTEQQKKHERKPQTGDLKGGIELSCQIPLRRLDHFLEKGRLAVDGMDLLNGLSQSEVHCGVDEVAAYHILILGFLELSDEFFNDAFYKGIESCV